MYTNKYAHMEGISFPPFFPLKTLQHSQQGNIWMHIQQPAVGMPNLPAESRFEIPKKKMLQLIFTVCNTQNMKYMKYTYCVYMRWYICNVYIICMYIHIYIYTQYQYISAYSNQHPKTIFDRGTGDRNGLAQRDRICTSA